MSEKIEPALTDEEWAELARPEYAPGTDARRGFVGREFSPSRPRAMIAALNDELPDSDPGKITREKIALIYGLLDHLQNGTEYHALIAKRDEIADFADGLKSYLRPETRLPESAP